MRAKVDKQKKARLFRKLGRSVGQIAKVLSVSKSSAYEWTKNIPIPKKLTKEYRARRKQKRLEKLRRVQEERKKNRVHGSTAGYRKVIRAPDGYKGKTHKKGRYVFEHRYLMEQYLGRLLREGEVVHHKNDDVMDNRIGNLEVKLHAIHSSEHGAARGRKFVVLRCPGCEIQFERPENKSFLVNGSMYTCCSRTCNGCFSRRCRDHRRNRGRGVQRCDHVLRRSTLSRDLARSAERGGRRPPATRD